MNTKEFEIPVPWGHIAVKTWGNEDLPVVLLFHGIMDNAGSFDRLIPLLPQETYHYVGIDLPGHGKSSHYPPFFPNYTINYIFAYKYITEYFKREKYIIIGHSYGGQIGFLFTKLYPELVEKLILLDTVHSYPVPAGIFNSTLRKQLESTIDIHKKITNGKPPVYTYEQALARLRDNRRYGRINQQAAEALIQRAIKPIDNNSNDDKYVFTMDQRMKEIINPFHDMRYIMENLYKRPVECPILFLLSTESVPQIMYMKDLLKFLKEFDNVVLKQVEGNHDVHNNNPELVSPHINEFLLIENNIEKNKAKL